MPTRRAACSCGQLHLTIEGEPSRISMCHCLECPRRTGAVISRPSAIRRFPRDRVAKPEFHRFYGVCYSSVTDVEQLNG
jgi:hypothetical protein